ncbi:TPA: hypothetical protein ACGOVU_002078 [Streptococcus suis]
MTFDYTFGLDLPELNKIISTKQFELSEELMDLRFKLGLTEEQMAKIIQIPIQDYLSMEFGQETIPIDRYESAISKMKEYAMLEKIAKIEVKNKVSCTKFIKIMAYY